MEFSEYETAEDVALARKAPRKTFAHFYMRSVKDEFLTDGGSRPVKGMAKDELERLKAAGCTIEMDDDDVKVIVAKAAGRPIHRQLEYIIIQTPGDRNNIPDKPVTDEHRKRYAQEYAAFKLGREKEMVGTPLASLPGFDVTRVDELAYFGVRTVEDLAGVSDGNAQGMGNGILKERQRATEFLEAASGRAPMTELQRERDELAEKLESLQSQVSQLLASRGQGEASTQGAHTPSEAGASPAPATKTRKPRKAAEATP